MTYPYFKICTYGNYIDLVTWSEHFEGLGIPYAITKKPRSCGYFSYALWIVKEEQMSPENIVNLPNSEALDGAIVEMWGGFENYMEAIAV